ncbi:YciE/YciF ferroxidase family protein [Shumkonia mesophila]|uniref:YciE/YciF ferroxidase family protein n=1 Tax=Shumkonia mesophila TaxID=2838854 RepID=UPI0029350EF7|nr:ferritin-like domain-containing protein [Shumkonia mesophila]
MQIDSLKDMYVAELQELASVERQLSASLPRMAAMATHPTLRSAFARHRKETEVQQERLESILERHGASPTAHTDQSMQALVGETEKMASMLKGDGLCDAALIASAQRLEHYEIAAYGTAAALAGQLNLRDDQEILHKSLEEEKHTDALLTELAKTEINPAAVAS